MAGYTPVITIGGSSTTDISEFEIEMSQEISLWHPCSGTPDWTRADFGAREVKLSFTARFDNDAIYKRYRNSQNDSFGFLARGDLIGSHDGTDYYQELAMTFPLVCYDSMEHDLGETNVLIQAEASVLPSAGSLTSLCTIQNTIASY